MNNLHFRISGSALRTARGPIEDTRSLHVVLGVDPPTYASLVVHGHLGSLPLMRDVATWEGNMTERVRPAWTLEALPIEGSMSGTDELYAW